MDSGNRARVILKGDGSVHIAFADRTTIYATVETLSKLMNENVLNFIEKEYQGFKSSTLVANRGLCFLDDIPGLTLALVKKNRDFVCYFQELYRYILSVPQDSEEWNKPINMLPFLETASELSDQKAFFLKFYLELHNASATFKKELSIKNNVRVDEATQTSIIREIINSIWDETAHSSTEMPDISTRLDQTQMNAVILPFLGKDDGKERMISTKEFAAIHNISPDTVRRYINAGKLKSAQRDNKGNWLVDKDDNPKELDLRAKRKRKHTVDGKNYKRKRAGSAAEVAEYIRKMNWFKEPLPDFIHSYEEVDFYIKRRYHQICLDVYGNATTSPGPGMKHYLVVDIVPEYISRRYGISNRKAIMEGKAPVVPDPMGEGPEPEWHLHHIGQNSKSPLALMNKTEHLSGEYYSIFHQGTPDKDLHGPSWEVEKISFYRALLALYDAYEGDFDKIPYLNPYAKRFK